MKTKKVFVLGATGSIGDSTLKIIDSNPDLFNLVGISAHSSSDALDALGRAYPQSTTVLTGRSDKRFDYSGDNSAIQKALAHTSPDIVVNGITGASGLIPSVMALEQGCDLALANKETIVMSGSLIFELAQKKNKRIIPVDSEHAALFELIGSQPKNHIHSVIITASGGALRDWPLDQLENASVDQVLNHPTWKMGPKITVDSATMANKGLEVIEAHFLFDMTDSQIDVVIHPQSIVHSLVRLNNGTLFAHMGTTDMCIPIQNALTYPEITTNPFGNFDITASELSFKPVDYERYPLLQTARDALKALKGYPLAYNAANEIAVGAFLKGTISYKQISLIVNKTLEADWGYLLNSFEDLIELDQTVRQHCRRIIKEVR